MRLLLRRIRGAIGMGIVWAIGGAAIGGFIELLENLFTLPQLNVVDMWIPLLAIPAFLGGVAFSIVLGIAARNRRFHDLSLVSFALWGALAGALLGVLMMAVGMAGPLLTPPLVVFSAIAAPGTLALARLGEKPSVDAGADAPELRSGPR